MKVFIAGIMQGSRLDSFIDDQGYRRQIAQAVLQRFAAAEIVDPNEIHPNGVAYGDALAKATLLEMAALATQADWWWPMPPRPAWERPSRCGRPTRQASPW
jgi:hypothetical protein